MSELDEFEEALQASLDSYVHSQSKKPVLPTKKISREHEGKTLPQTNTTEATPQKRKGSTEKKSPSLVGVKHIVTLRVRRKQIAIDEYFTHRSSKLSTLEAQIDAEKEAKAAGFPIIAFVEKWETL